MTKLLTFSLLLFINTNGYAQNDWKKSFTVKTIKDCTLNNSSTRERIEKSLRNQFSKHIRTAFNVATNSHLTRPEFVLHDDAINFWWSLGEGVAASISIHDTQTRLLALIPSTKSYPSELLDLTLQTTGQEEFATIQVGLVEGNDYVDKYGREQVKIHYFCTYTLNEIKDDSFQYKILNYDTNYEIMSATYNF